MSYKPFKTQKSVYTKKPIYYENETVAPHKKQGLTQTIRPNYYDEDDSTITSVFSENDTDFENEQTYKCKNSNCNNLARKENYICLYCWAKNKNIILPDLPYKCQLQGCNMPILNKGFCVKCLQRSKPKIQCKNQLCDGRARFKGWFCKKCHENK